MADRNFLNATLQAAQQEIFASPNILFLGDLADIFQPIRDMVLEREKIHHEACRHDTTWNDDSKPRDPLTLLGGIQPELVVECCAKAEHLAFYAFPYDPPSGPFQKDPFINTRLMLQLLQWIKEMRTLYIVLNMRGFHKTSGLTKPRLVLGTTGLGRSPADVGGSLMTMCLALLSRARFRTRVGGGIRADPVKRQKMHNENQVENSCEKAFVT